ncbi:hypothetical protein [Actibacterium sp. 188UL27-1]|uniref:hypothetical protein n=1 Tax=Actibacterium sp. 188UL27-1 TaxID=2786961 RepID=UPI00195D357A|nr:hypothetical protein [Actibacterium sp. 188UL27-1]
MIIGKSAGNGAANDQGPHRGHSIYDGPSGIDNVHFVNFNGRDSVIQTNEAAEKAATH